MAEFRVEKVISALPDPVEPNTVYFVRTGEGFEVYVSDSTGSTAHLLNAPDVTPGDPWTLSADSVSFSYDSEGVITELTESVDGDIRTTTYTYTDGVITEIETEFLGLVRTETLTYVDGVLDESIAVVEEAT